MDGAQGLAELGPPLLLPPAAVAAACEEEEEQRAPHSRRLSDRPAAG